MFLAGRGGSERGTRLASAVVRAAAAHQHDGLPLRLLRQNRALKRLGVLYDVVIARKGQELPLPLTMTQASSSLAKARPVLARAKGGRLTHSELFWPAFCVALLPIRFAGLR